MHLLAERNELRHSLAPALESTDHAALRHARHHAVHLLAERNELCRSLAPALESTDHAALRHSRYHAVHFFAELNELCRSLVPTRKGAGDGAVEQELHRFQGGALLFLHPADMFFPQPQRAHRRRVRRHLHGATHLHPKLIRLAPRRPSETRQSPFRQRLHALEALLVAADGFGVLNPGHERAVLHAIENTRRDTGAHVTVPNCFFREIAPFRKGANRC